MMVLPWYMHGQCFFCAHIALFCVNLVNFHWQKQIKPYFGVVVDGVEILITMFTRIKASRGILQFFLSIVDNLQQQSQQTTLHLSYCNPHHHSIMILIMHIQFYTQIALAISFFLF